MATDAPNFTKSPSLALTSARVPSTGASISTLTLSVSTSSSASPFLTAEPGTLIQRRILTSSLSSLEPKRGTITSVVIKSPRELERRSYPPTRGASESDACSRERRERSYTEPEHRTSPRCTNNAAVRKSRYRRWSFYCRKGILCRHTSGQELRNGISTPLRPFLSPPECPPGASHDWHGSELHLTSLQSPNTYLCYSHPPDKYCSADDPSPTAPRSPLSR